MSHRKLEAYATCSSDDAKDGGRDAGFGSRYLRISRPFATIGRLDGREVKNFSFFLVRSAVRLSIGRMYASLPDATHPVARHA
jgi:hypothetical protein